MFLAGYVRPHPGHQACIEATSAKELAMLRILYGACATALDAFRAADNPVDEQLVADLETMVERTKGEIERLSAYLAKPPGS
jgi:hypothetical protein